MLRLQFEMRATLGQPIDIGVLPDVCGYLRCCEAQCAEMETRLAGEILPAALINQPDTNVVSLAAFVAARATDAAFNSKD
ncbi:hypothetical protein ASE04_27615 [Rhizobium sp. Root708]|nr:hypothetical protein ASE04_27615 [Rhizobium sp. Root708]